MTHDAELMAARRWTPEEDARLASLLADGRRSRQIAEILGRTRTAVLHRGERLRAAAREAAAIPAAPPTPDPVVEPEPEPAPTAPAHDVTMDSLSRRAWTPDEDGRLAELRRAGRTDFEIGGALGRTPGAVQVRISTLRLRDGVDVPSRRRRSRWTLERVAEVRTLARQGLTVNQIARRMGTAPGTVGLALKSPVTTEDSPGEGVRVGRTVPDLARADAEVERAMAELARAKARRREAMGAFLVPVREAMEEVGMIVVPVNGLGDEPEDEPAWQLVDQLRRRGVELRRVS